jgi:hypothetical protein
VLQLGVGSGVKGALVVWQALRDIPPNRHAAWFHLNGVPYQDADLPRSIMEDSKAQAEFDAAANKAAAASAAAHRASTSTPPTPS